MLRYVRKTKSSSGEDDSNSGPAVKRTKITIAPLPSQEVAAMVNDAGRLFTDQLRSRLAADGYVIVPGVLPASVCDEVYQGLLEFYNTWHPSLHPERPENWRSPVLPPGPHGLVQFMGHLPCLWTVRQNPRVAQVFAELHRVSSAEQLLTSFDGFRFLLHGRNYHRKNWPHTDEGPAGSKLPFSCVQGSLAIRSSEHPDDGDFVCWAKSNHAHAGYFKRNPDAASKVKDNWFKYPEEYTKEIELDGSKYCLEPPLANNGVGAVMMPRVRVRRAVGDMVLWYSRTAHQSDPPLPSAPDDAVAVFVCQAPRIYAKPHEIEKRIRAFHERRTSTHWPVQHFHTFPTKPRLWSTEENRAFEVGMQRVEPLVRQPAAQVLTPLGRCLVGF